MKLYHWTFRDVMPAILLRGLLCRMAKGKLPVVWMCDSSRYADVQFHIAERHDRSEEDMILLSIQVDEDELVRSRWPGVYHVRHDIPPEWLAVVIHESEGLREFRQDVTPPPECLSLYRDRKADRDRRILSIHQNNADTPTQG